jgi:hypothetical protein
MAAPTSGTYAWAPTAGELINFCFREAGIRRAQVEEEHLVDARMCANMIFSDWANDQPHLWAVELLSVPLIQGVAAYQLPGNTVLVLDAYLRTFQLPNVFNQTPSFSTVTDSDSITVGITNHGLSPGNWVNIVVPVSVGGLIVLGYYQVATVPNGDEFTIIAASEATATITDGGVVPQFIATLLSSTITVSFPNHGQLGGFIWNVPIATQVGGVVIQGAYTVQSVIDADTFTITAAQEAAYADSEYENGGEAQVAGQSATTQPTDRIMWPIGRSEYASYPNKQYQAPPTVEWFDRLVNPTITFYPTPDAFGPYAAQLYTVRQNQDVNPTFAETVDLPYRFNAAFASELSLRLAVIYGPDRVPMLEKRRDRLLGRAQSGDTEKVPMYVIPNFGSYQRR